MSKWNHSLCRPCYGDLEPGREPVRVPAEDYGHQVCCRCGVLTNSGIYYRANPEKFTHCNHKEKED